MVFSPDSRRLVVAYPSGTNALRVLDVAQPEHVVLLTNVLTVTSLDYSPDGHLLVTGDNNGEVNLWDIPLSDESHPTPLLWSDDPIVSVRFSPTGRHLAV